MAGAGDLGLRDDDCRHAGRAKALRRVCAVMTARMLLTTSANFTQSGVDRNIEAGTLIRGGSAPARAAEHVSELQRTGVLRRFW
ncbi:hypothetical protein GCM10018966_049550 [Streptomyces yanii]